MAKYQVDTEVRWGVARDTLIIEADSIWDAENKACGKIAEEIQCGTDNYGALEDFSIKCESKCIEE